MIYFSSNHDSNNFSRKTVIEEMLASSVSIYIYTIIKRAKILCRNLRKYEVDFKNIKNASCCLYPKFLYLMLERLHIGAMYGGGLSIF